MKAPKNKLSPTTFKVRPTILQVIPALGSGGVEIETLEIGKAIAEAGGRSLIAANQRDWTQDDLPDHVELINLPLDTKNPIKISKNAKLLKEIIQKEKVDIVHVRSRAPAWSAYKATKSLGIPFITTHHAAYGSKTILKTFYNSVMARGDRVIAISQFMADHIAKQYKRFSWFDPHKIRLINRGIDCHYFDPSSISTERLEHIRKSWEIPEGMRIILLPGRISRSKGQDVLIKALSLMRNANVIAVLLGSAIGHEAQRDTLLKHAVELDLEGRVKWFPPSPDVPGAYKLADIIVSPSLVPEGFGRVIAESFAMKKPIVASNIGAPRDLIDEGKTGWLVPPGDAYALAEVLDKILDSSESTLKQVGERERKLALSEYSKEIMCNKTMSLYEEILQGT